MHPPFAPIRAITLDLDDTLWPVRPALIRAEQELSAWLAARAPAAAAAYDMDTRMRIRREVVEAHAARAHDVSFVRHESLRRVLAEAGEDPALASPAFEHFLAHRRLVEPYEDVLPVLERWARRYRIVALSNGNADVGHAGLGHVFHAQVSAHELPYAKPDARIFEQALQQAGVSDPSQVLHVGDDLLLDVDAALAAGLQAAWIQRPDLVIARAARQANRSTEGKEKPAAARPREVPFAWDSLASLDRALHAMEAFPPG